jgi:hypothetical protein
MSFIAIVALIAGPIERRRDESWERAGCKIAGKPGENKRG